MSNQKPQVDKWILSPPGGPAGIFWGIVTQSGKVIALQIVEREHAEILRLIGNLLEGDFDTNRDVGRKLRIILERDLPSRFSALDVGSEDYLARAVVEALAAVAQEGDD